MAAPTETTQDVPPAVPPKSPMREFSYLRLAGEEDFEASAPEDDKAVQIPAYDWQASNVEMRRPPADQQWRKAFKHDWSQTSVRPPYYQCNWYYFGHPLAHGADKLPRVFDCVVCKYRHINPHMRQQSLEMTGAAGA